MNVGLISLGCDKNRVDSEKVLYYLKENGYDIITDLMDADALIINTCAFVDRAKEESVSIILEALEIQKEKNLKIVIIGCLAQRYFDTLKNEFPTASIVCLDRYESIPIILQSDFPDFLSCKEKNLKYKNNSFDIVNIGRISTTLSHIGYLKIADGCDNFCSYCAIPFIRGRYRSIPLDVLINEAKFLKNNGVKELMIIAQDTTKYGFDLYHNYGLLELLKELTKIDFWKIRILYAYPELVDEKLINFISENDKMAKYIDMPIQHINDDLLISMNRKASKYEIIEKINKIKKINRDIAIRSSFIVGYPGESKSQFVELFEFIEKGLIDHVGIFKYSREEGTKAYDLKPQILEKIKSERYEALYQVQHRNVISKNREFIGARRQVIIDYFDEDVNCYVGRFEQSCFEVDNIVYIDKKDKKIESGDILDVVIYDAELDFYASFVE